MSSLKGQQKKLLRNEIAGKAMEYLMGLNEKNKLLIGRVSKKSAKQIVNAYYKAIKEQHKKVLKATAKKEKNAEVLPITEPAASTEQTNLIAS